MVNNILITGSNSYLGKEVVKKICTNNYFALDSRKINNSQITPIKNFRDIKENKIDTLYHFANFLSEKDGLYSFKDENLFLNEVMKNGIKNILYSGTYWSEMIEYKDLDYVKHKNLITEKLISSNNEKSIKVCLMILGDIYGPGDTRTKLIPYLLSEEMKKEVHFKSNKESEICLTHVDDVINFIYNEAFKNNFQKAEIIGEKKMLYEVVEIFKRVRNRNFKATFADVQVKPINYESTSSIAFHQKINIERGFKKL